MPMHNWEFRPYACVWAGSGQQLSVVPLMRGIKRTELEALPLGLYFYRFTLANGSNMVGGKVLAMH